MPEIAEAHTMAEELSIINDCTIVSIDIYSNNQDKFSGMELTKGRKIIEIFAIGKHVIMELDSGFIYSTLSMTGKWLLPSVHLNKYSDYIKLRIGYGKISGRITRIKGFIYFIDSRTWGSVKFLTQEKYISTMSKLGPDPLNGELNLRYFEEAITKKSIGRRQVCDFLNDQAIISGIGNYCRAELLYDAKIDPFRSISTLTQEEINKLYHSVIKVVNLAFEHKGFSIDDGVGNYVTPNGKKGACPMTVYGRSVCPLGHLVSKEKSRGGSQNVYFCPEEQV